MSSASSKAGGKKSKSKLGAAAATSAIEDEEHMLGILASLFTNLASDSPERIRVIAKFVEGGYEKVERLLEVREAAEGRLGSVIKEIEYERKVSLSLLFIFSRFLAAFFFHFWLFPFMNHKKDG